MRSGSILKKLKPVAIGSAMADMALLLLVFFMASTTTEPPKGVEVQLPVAVTRGAEQDSIYITIAGNGAIYFEGSKVTADTLNDFLAMRQSEKDRVVALTADRNLQYSVVNEVMNILQQQGFLNVVFMSEQKKTLID